MKSAHFHVSALGLYLIEINGTRVGNEVFAPGWTDYTKRVQYQTYDVTALLHPGENVAGAILGDGWYCGYVGWASRQNHGDRPRLLAQIDMVFEDGSQRTIGTDASWTTATGPILQGDLLMGESYDARLELGAWSQPGFAADGWQAALISPPALAVAIEPRLGPPVRCIQELTPVARREVNPRLLVFDLGQNFCGRIRARFQASRGKTVRFRFAEALDAGGNLYTENLRGAQATDYYTFKSDAPESWESHFTFHGFRHVEALMPEGGGSVEVTGIVLHSDTPATGTFRCSHELLNRLQQNIVWSQKSNFLEVPTDCPQRNERLGWTGDAQVFIRTAAFNMDVRGFFHKWVRDIRDAQRANGAIPSVAPQCACVDAEDGGPAWSDATIICPWTIYLCYGDAEILKDHFESMARFMDFVAAHRCRGHIRNHPDLNLPEWGPNFNGYGDWLALDGSGETQGQTPHDLIGTAFYAYDAELMAAIATVLGRKAEAEKYRRLRSEIAEAFRRRYMTEEGLVASGTQTAYVLALHFDLVPKERRTAAGKELVRLVERRDFHLGTGFVGTPYILDVLESIGRLDVAYRLLEQETFPSWLYPVKHGATTMWERWDGWTTDKGFQNKDMNSFNHYAYGAVGAWMVRSVAGLDLDPEAPGYRRIRFRPRPGGSLTWAEAAIRVGGGSAGIRWEFSGSALELTLTVPEGSTGSLEPPDGYVSAEKSFGPGTHRRILERR